MYNNDGTHTWWDTNIIKVSLPEGLLNIGSNAFEDCVLVTGIEIPSTVTEIRQDAFKGCTGLKE